MRRIIKAAGILARECIHHLLHNTTRRKNLIRLLRWDIVENILLLRLIKVVREFLSLLQELRNRVVKYHLIENMTREMILCPRLRIPICPAITQKAEFCLTDARDFLEYIVICIVIEICERHICIAVRHDKTRNRP